MKEMINKGDESVIVSAKQREVTKVFFIFFIK